MSTPPTPASRRGASATRIDELIATFAAITEPGSGPGVTRLCYTPLERQAHELFAEHMRALDLRVWTDAAGNTIAERPGTAPGGPAIGTGSHLDSVPHAGAYDGVAGVVAGMEVARLYTENKVEHVHPIRFVAFAAEEGARFGQAMTGSRIVAGATAPGDLDSLRDAGGVTMAEAMRSVGIDPAGVAAARWDPTAWAAFVELHVEQGTVLDQAGVPVGVVDLISGSTRMVLRVTGRASHTGGTPMHQRADALAAAAEVVLRVEAIAANSRPPGSRATVGRLTVEPGSITTIAGAVTVYVDVRDVDVDRQRKTAAEIVRQAKAICDRRGVQLDSETLAEALPEALPTWPHTSVIESCSRVGVPFQVLASGASHDSQMINKVTPAAMIFVPSHDGISHAPQEWTSGADLATGTEVLAGSLLALDRRLAGGEATP